MKKLVVLMLLLVSLSLVGCGKKDDIPVTVDRTETENSSNKDDIKSSVKVEDEEEEKDEENQDTKDIENKPVYESKMDISEEEELEDTSESSDLSIDFVKEIITTLMSSTSQSDIDSYLESIETDSQFSFNTIVNKETSVYIENIGVSSSSPDKYLAIVTLKQDEGISKFSVFVGFEDSKLKSFDFKRF